MSPREARGMVPGPTIPTAAGMVCLHAVHLVVTSAGGQHRAFVTRGQGRSKVMINEDPGSVVTRPDVGDVDRVATWRGLSPPAAGGGDGARTIPGGHVAWCRRSGQGVETGALAAAGDVCLPCRHLVAPLIPFCTWRHGRAELAGGWSPLALRAGLSPVPAAGGDKVHVGQAGRRHHGTAPSVATAGDHPGAAGVATSAAEVMTEYVSARHGDVATRGLVTSERRAFSPLFSYRGGGCRHTVAGDTADVAGGGFCHHPGWAGLSPQIYDVTPSGQALLAGAAEDRPCPRTTRLILKLVRFLAAQIERAAPSGIFCRGG